jgi:preprotein translocase subunit SecD
MAKNLRWKLLVILGVIALSAYAFYPPSERIRLGLDLKGGVHLVLRVQTDDALRLETETTIERLRETLKTQNIPVGNILATSVNEFTVEGVPADQDAAFRQALTDVELVFNRSSGAGGSYTFTMRPNIVVQLRDEAVTQALQTIERRVNELGVAEPIVARRASPTCGAPRKSSALRRSSS